MADDDGTRPTDEDSSEDEGLDRDPVDESPSDTGVQAERQEEGVEAEQRHE